MTRTHARRLVAAPLVLLGIGTVVALIRHMGPGRILEQMTVLGPVLPLVMFITAGKYPLQTVGWRLALPAHDRPPWWRSLAATLAGDSIGYLTFAGPVCGEPARALLLREHLKMPISIAVGAFERTMYTFTGTVIVIASIVFAAARAGATQYWMFAVVALAFAAGALIVLRWRRCQRPRRNAAEWRGVLRDLWMKRRATVAVIVLLGVLEHTLLGVEAAVMLRALGAHPTLRLILTFEGLTKTVNSVGSLVPGRIGVAESGSALLAGGLGVGASLGLSLSLMRRARAVLWSIAGFGAIAMLGVPWRELTAACGSDERRDDPSSRDDISSPVVDTTGRNSAVS